MKKIVLSFFDFTGNMVEPWAADGHECHIFDIRHPPGSTQKAPGITAHHADLLSGKIDEITAPFTDPAIIFAFPPCTDAACIGARYWKTKGPEALRDLGWQWMQVEKLRDDIYPGVPYMFENPRVGHHLTHFIGKPAFKFHPWFFGDAYTKETWLWTGNGFKMPAREWAAPDEGPGLGLKVHEFIDKDYITHMTGNKERGDKRSITPKGFARAVWSANCTGKRGRPHERGKRYEWGN